MKKQMTLTGLVCVLVGCVNGSEVENVTYSEQAIQAGTYSITLPEVRCRLAQLSSVRFKATKSEWVKLGVEGRTVDGMLSDLLAVERDLCWTDAGPGNFAQARQWSDLPRSSAAIDLSAKIRQASAKIGTNRGISTDAAQELLTTTMMRAVDRNAALKTNVLTVYLPKTQFDQAIGLMKMRAQLTSTASPIGRISLADTLGGSSCVSKKTYVDEWENGSHRLGYETKYANGASLKQEHLYDSQGRVIYTKTESNTNDGNAPTIAIMDNRKEMSSRAADYGRLAEKSIATAGLLASIGFTAGIAPEPIATKISALGLETLAAGFTLQAAVYKALALYIGDPAYFPDTLDRSPCPTTPKPTSTPTNLDAGTNTGTGIPSNGGSGTTRPTVCAKQGEWIDRSTYWCLGNPNASCYCVDTRGCCYVPGT